MPTVILVVKHRTNRALSLATRLDWGLLALGAMALSMLDAADPQTEASDDADLAAQHLRTSLLRRIAHDIASPTGVALTVLDELSEGSQRPELATMARRSLRRLMRLSENLALCAELERGELTLEPMKVDISAVARRAVEEAQAIDGRKGVSLTMNIPEDLASLKGDARLLEQIFREIVGNALKIASGRVVVAVTRVGDAVELRVDDDGPGFTAEARALVGTRFVNESTRGLGISLSLAFEIARLHGGAITVASSHLEPGRSGQRGAAVILRLPC